MKILFKQFLQEFLKESHHYSEKIFDDLGNVLRMNTGKAQKRLSFGYPGYVLSHKAVNPKFSKDKPYMILIKQNGQWQMHFENFSKLGKRSDILNDFYQAVADTCTPEMEIYAKGGATPGGISGISKLENYGFKKVFCDPTDLVYWGGELDQKKLKEWLTGGKHLNDFLVTKDGSDHKWNFEDDKWVVAANYQGNEPFTMSNTKPRPFKMVKV